MKCGFKMFCAFISSVLFFAFSSAKAGGYFGCADLYKVDKKTGEVVEHLGFGGIHISGDIHHTYRLFESEKLKISTIKWFSCDDEKAACADACKDKYVNDDARLKCSTACYDSFDKHCPPGKNNAGGEYDRFKFEVCDKSGERKECRELKSAINPNELTYISIKGERQKEVSFFEEDADSEYAYYYKQGMPRNMHFNKLKDAGYFDEYAEEKYALENADYALRYIEDESKYKACLNYDETVAEQFKKQKGR